ncbi:helicase [Pseudolabrys taiwanensis]|uniref:Helicase n=1 Tax=Pseudolabrys taiwanensis TaxID=331696 RepID=A0A345ZYK7_9HYPH|nr:helicase-related protein [Pseudolabrys taiwanensis]AXK82004.1 helicase [Pseudolabrys taiwanensis]
MAITFSSQPARAGKARGAGVTAVLGPTNTGKTHLAIERMLAHSSGMIGLPLRLLAREVYNKVVDRVGAPLVALITGEEKIKPPTARYWVSTVEAMPRDLDVAFLAIDEIQLGADFERGHVFTDRILNLRAREETLVLGAATMRPMVEKLLPGAHIISRPRLSMLTYAGDKKITRLPRRSAVVAFSADEVYAIAELIRRQRGGAAVVLGALSPRTRNAQVALYQSGDVDYLVATDAIGMGLNLDVDHVAFASDRKFDGYQFRKLNPAEMAQIAGRAGRAARDGTFGTTGRCDPFEPELVQALESHTFEPVRLLQWRNADLDFSSIGALQASLAMAPQEQGLTRAPVGEDILVLEHAARDEDVRALARNRAAVERLWDVCQVPDYRKIAPATHAELVVALYGFLMREGNIPTDWFARQVALADRTDGDIDTLSTRIAHVRTWTFVANRPDWLADPEHWQATTRAVEDKLSDALHERLAERFVDRRTSVLMRRLRENTMLETEIGKTGEVTVEGHMIGRLDGFMFAPDASAAAGSEAKALNAAAQKVLAVEIEARATRLSQAPADQIVLANDGVIRWLGDVVGRLTAGDDTLRPRVRIIADEHLTGPSRDLVQTRLDLWLKSQIEKLLAPLFTLSAAEDITGMARGVAFQVVEALGVLERQKVAEEVKGLDQPSRATLRKYGVRFGAYHIYLPALLKPAPRALATQLWALKHEAPDAKGVAELLHLAASGRTSIPVDKETSKALYRTVGYRVTGERAVRVDILERLADLIRPALSWREGAPGPKPDGAVDGRSFTVTGAMTSLTGASGEDFATILRSLGYRMERRPKPPEPEVTPAAAGMAPVAPEEATTEAPVETTAQTEALDAAIAGDEAAVGEATSALTTVPDAEVMPQVEAVAESAAAEAPAAPAEATPDAPTEAAAAATEGEAKSDEPALIEVWRPGGRPEKRPPRPQHHRRPQHRHGATSAPAEGTQEGATAAPVEGAAVPAEAGGPERRDRQDRRDRHERHQKMDRQHQRGDRQDAHGRPDRGPRRGPRRDRDSGPDRADREKYYAKPHGSDRRDKQPDPNSPFAKLAALKQQLEQGGKEPS